MGEHRAPDEQGGIRVDGVGRISAPPDLMVINTAVQAQHRNPGRAYERAKAALSQVREVVLKAGVASSDLQTSQVQLYPSHDHNGKPNGHEARLGLHITVRDISGSGVLIDAITAASGDEVQLSGISFEHSDPTELERRARAAAIVDAQQRAGELAAGVGREIGECLAIREGADSTPPLYGGRPQLMRASMASADLAVDAGEVDVEVSVSGWWSFRE